MENDCPPNCRFIHNFFDYCVNTDGEIFSKKTGTWVKLKKQTHNCGYHIIQLCKDGKRQMYYIHRLVAKTFLDDYSEDLEVDHKNHDKKDNRLKNLRMVTPSQNQKNKIDKEFAGLDFSESNRIRASWFINKKQIRKDFSIKKYGFAFAFIMAFDHREEKVKEFYKRPQ